MGLANYAAENDLAVLREPSHNAIFFPFLPGPMVILTMTVANILMALAFVTSIAFLVYRFRAKLQKSRFITVIIASVAIIAAILAIIINVLSYLFWIPLLFVSASAFQKNRPNIYKCAMTVSGVVTLLLWVPPVYLLLVLVRVIPS